PFNHKAFVTGDFSFKFFNINIRSYQLFADELLTCKIPSVQINCSDKSLKKISVDIFPKMFSGNFARYKLNETELFSEVIQVITIYNFRSHFGQITFILIWNFSKKIGCNHTPKHCIS